LFLLNQSSMASRRRSRGTRAPISIKPSVAGSVSSKTGSLVKLRMAKLSSHFSGQGVGLPATSYWTLIFLEYTLSPPPGCHSYGPCLFTGSLLTCPFGLCPAAALAAGHVLR